MRVADKFASVKGGSRSVKRNCVSAAVLLALSVPSQAFAQAAPQSAGSPPSPTPAQSPASAPAQPSAAPSGAANADSQAKLESVVVTARMRAESVQDIPASVKVFSARTLEDAGVTQINDFISLTPNASIVKTQSAGISFITIRGLSQVRNGDAPIAMVVDGVQVPNSKSFTQDLFDLQSVQMLRGPQGALYGRNAPGGAMLITTKAPKNELEGFIQAGAGTGSEKSTKGAVSGAIVPDTLLFRTGGIFTDRDGYFDNVNLGQKQDPYRDATGQGMLRWIASNALTVDLRVAGSHTTGGANNFVAQTIQYDPANRCRLDPVAPFGGPAPDPNFYVRDYCSSYIGHNDRKIKDVSVKADYELSFGTLTGIVGYNRVKEFEGGTQFPYTATPNLFGFLNGTQTQYTDDTGRSLEVRLASPQLQPVRWMGGVYFLKSRGFISTSTGRDNGQGIAELTDTPQPLDPANPTLSWLADTRRDTAKAVFGNVAVDVTKNIEASAGFRYDKAERHKDVQPQIGGVPGGCTAATPANCVNDATFSSFQPTAALRYKINETLQVYGTAGKGFRAGQFNQSGAAAAAQAAGTTGVQDKVGSETTTSAELGFKSEFDNALRIEGSVFRSVVKGAQYFLFIPSISAQVLANIDKITLTGGELEVASTVAKGLDIYAGLGVTVSHIDQYALDPSAVGKWAPYVPRMSVNVGTQYRFPIGHGLAMMLRADAISKGKQYWDPENSAPRSTVNLLNLRMGLEDIKRKWSLTASAVNATDREYNEEFVAGGFGHPANPRVIRIDLRYNF